MKVEREVEFDRNEMSMLRWMCNYNVIERNERDYKITGSGTASFID